MLETRGYEQTGDPRRAFWGAPAVATGRPQGAARHRLPRRHPARRPHRRLRLRAQDDARARRVREGRGGLRDGGRPRLVDQAVGRLDPDLAAARAAPRGAAARPARPRRPDDRPPAATSAASRPAPRSRTRSSTTPSPPSTRASRSSPGCTATTTGRSKLVGADVVVDRGARLPRRARGPADLPLRAHDGPARALRAAAAVRPHVRAAPDARATRRATRAPTTRSRSTASAWSRSTTATSRSATGSSAASCASCKARGPLRRRADRLPRRPRRGVPRPRPLAARAQPVRRADPRAAGRQVPRQQVGGQAGRRSRCRCVDVLPTVLEALGAAAALRPSRGLPLQRRRGGPGRAAAGARRDQPPRLRRPRRAHGAGQVHPPLQPRGRHALLRPAAGPGGAATTSRRRTAQRVRPLEARAEAGMAPNPFRYVMQVAGSGRFELQLAVARLARGRRDRGLRAARSAGQVGGNGRWLQIDGAAARRGARARSASRCGPVGAPVELSGTRDGRAAARRRRVDRRDGLPPAALPLRLPDIESETDADRGLVLFKAPPDGTAGRARLAGAATGQHGAGARPSDARAAEGARLRRPGLDRLWPCFVFDLDGTLVDSSRDLAPR